MSFDPNGIITVGNSTCIPAGGTVRIDCNTQQGTPPLTYTWTRDGNALATPDPPSRFNAMVRGNYTCAVSNNIGNDDSAISWIEGQIAI